MIVARPLDIGEIFDRGVTIIVRRWRLVAPLCMLSALPETIFRVLNRGDAPSSEPVIFFGFAVDLLVFPLTCAALVLTFGEPSAPVKGGALLRAAARVYRRSLGAFLAITVTCVASSLRC